MAGDGGESSQVNSQNDQNDSQGEKTKKPNNRKNTRKGTAKGGGGTVVEREGAIKREDRSKGVHNHKVDMRKYDKMIIAAQDNFADIVSTGSGLEECTICCKSSDLFGIGRCRHPVCMECAIRMRVLAEIPTCPVCRANVDTLYFAFVGSGLNTMPLEFPKSQHPDEDRFNIRFENEVVGCRYEKYLAHVCKICKVDDGERLEFPTFVSLRQHVAQVHKLSFCHICTDNLSLFSRERKTYSREELSRHIRHGDRDDKSQKGHPSCLFCEQRFFDEEGRYKHLRKEHFFCQFCEAMGFSTNVFYGKHQELVAHYAEHHFICDVPECKEMGIAFANPIDLKIHKSKEHGGSRQGLALDFQFSDRQLGGRGGSRSSRGGDLRRRGESSRDVPKPTPARPPPEERDTFVVVPSANYSGPVRYSRRPAYDMSANQEQFPTLGGDPSSSARPQVALNPNSFPRLDKVNKISKNASQPASHVEDFPTLGGRPQPVAQQPKNEQWTRNTSGIQVTNEDVRNGASSSARSYAPLPQQRTNLVVHSASTAPAQAASLKKKDIGTPVVTEEFPSLPAPAPANNPNLNKGFSWNRKQHSNGQITGAIVPSSFSAASTRHASGLITRPANPNQGQPKKRKKKNKQNEECAPSRSPPPYVEPPEPEWEDVPFVPKKQKGRKGKHVEKPCIVGAIVPDNFGGRRLSSSSEDAQSSDSELQKKNVPQKKQESLAKKQVTARTQPSTGKVNYNATQQTKNSQSKPEITKDFPSLSTTDLPSPSEGRSILGGLSSFIGMFSSLTSGWSSAAPIESEALFSKSTSSETSKPVVSETTVTSSVLPEPLISTLPHSSLIVGPPPGFEGCTPKRVPTTSSNILFENVPMLSAEDVRKSKEDAVAKVIDPEGWATIPKKVPIKKNDRKN